MARTSDLLIVNGVRFPVPADGLQIVTLQAVNAGRNANGATVGQLVGRRLYKLNNLQWNGLDMDTWKRMRRAIEDFYFPVTFTDDLNERKTITMYPGDTTGQPLFARDIFYTNFRTCKFNLIDCGLE